MREGDSVAVVAWRVCVRVCERERVNGRKEVKGSECKKERERGNTRERESRTHEM